MICEGADPGIKITGNVKQVITQNAGFKTDYEALLKNRAFFYNSSTTSLVISLILPHPVSSMAFCSSSLMWFI